MGLIAKVATQVQLVYDIKKARADILQKINYRIDKLNNIRNLHREAFNVAIRKNTLKNNSYSNQSNDSRNLKRFISPNGSLVLESNFYMT